MRFGGIHQLGTKARFLEPRIDRQQPEVGTIAASWCTGSWFDINTSTQGSVLRNQECSLLKEPLHRLQVNPIAIQQEALRQPKRGVDYGDDPFRIPGLRHVPASFPPPKIILRTLRNQ